MNNLFKEEFKKLNKTKLKEIINGCAGQDILEHGFSTTFSKDAGYSKNKTTYAITYVKDDNYGFWSVQWQWKTNYYVDMPIGGIFENSIKITPFNVTFDIDSFAPFANTNKKKNLKEYLFIYINKQCPHYKQAVKEEAEKFITFLGNDEEENTL